MTHNTSDPDLLRLAEIGSAVVAHIASPGATMEALRYATVSEVLQWVRDLESDLHEHVAALDEIRATCIDAGVPEETTDESGTTTWWSTPHMVRELARMADDADYIPVPCVSVDWAATSRVEIERLRGWLAVIEGGDTPCDDASQLRRWAYEALTLGREVSG